MDNIYIYIGVVLACSIWLAVDIYHFMSNKYIKAKGLVKTSRFLTEKEIIEYDSHYNILCQIEYTFEGEKYNCEMPMMKIKLPKQNQEIDIMFNTKTHTIISRIEFQIGRILSLAFITIFAGYLLYCEMNKSK